MARARNRHAAKEFSVNDQPTDRPRRPAPQLADYPHRVADVIRFGDLDPQGHVNQAVFLTYFESGRVAMFRNPDLGIGVPGATFVMVRMEIDYVKELHWPGTIEIGTGVSEFGRSSFKVAQAIFRDGACAAMGRATLVCIDLATRKPRPLPEEAIARLSQWKHGGQ
jgi:acyl-CoA thioester hydrolase